VIYLINHDSKGMLKMQDRKIKGTKIKDQTAHWKMHDVKKMDHKTRLANAGPEVSFFKTKQNAWPIL